MYTSYAQKINQGIGVDNVGKTESRHTVTIIVQECPAHLKSGRFLVMLTETKQTENRANRQ